MSKLFEALQKIEQQNVQPLLPPADSVVKKRSTRQTMLLLPILLLLFVMAGVALVYLYHHSKLFSFKSDTIAGLQTTPTTSHAGKPAPPNKADRQQQTRKLPTPVQVASRIPDVADKPSSQHQAATAGPEIKTSLSAKQAAFVNKPDPAKQLQKQREKELKRTVQQILYQAEERRKEGDMEAAVILYRRAWKLQKSPATANNLAAGLIVSGKYREARNILQKALAIAPDDADLQYNLKIAKERLAY